MRGGRGRAANELQSRASSSGSAQGTGLEAAGVCVCVVGGRTVMQGTGLKEAGQGEGGCRVEAASTNGVGGNGVEFSVHLVLFLGEGFCQKEEAGGREGAISRTGRAVSSFTMRTSRS